MTDRKIMEQALADLKIAEVDGNCNYGATELLRNRLAQPEQKPVAWMRQDGQRVTTASDRHNYPDYEIRYSIPLYTAPPQREWQRLTDKEREEATGWSVEHIEAKLKEKNT